MSESGPRKLDYLGEVPSWVQRFLALDEESQLAWDERVRRIDSRTATTEDERVQEIARAALQLGRPLPPEARKMPTLPPLKQSESTWTSSTPSAAERVAAFGVPPLIAARIAGNEYRETRSTRVCSRVGIDCCVLVLIGERGCGKSYAAALWLVHGRHVVPSVMRRLVRPRRFLEAPMLADVPFDERAAIGDSIALALDDMGTEKDFLVNDLAALLVRRYRNALPTVITTNLSEHDFNERYGMRFADRMREVGRYVVVSNNARDSLRGDP